MVSVAVITSTESNQALQERVTFRFVGSSERVMSCLEMLLHRVKHTVDYRGFMGDRFNQAGLQDRAT